MAPWKAPRHRSWASDTNVTTFFAVIVVAVYIGWEMVGEAPQGMVTLVGLAGGALFGAVSGDKRKRDHDTERTAERAVETAERAETKADRLVQVAESEHPEATEETGLPEPRKPSTDPKRDDDGDGGGE